MMHAKIYSGGSQQKRADTIVKELSDLKIFQSDTLRLEPDDEKERIGIAQVRDFSRRMILGPTVSQYMIGIIEHAELLTTESQNALLKIIEEPPSHAIFLLGTPTIGALLPTIASRCQHITIEDTTEEASEWQIGVRKQILELLESSPGAIMSIVNSIATDRVVTKQWIEEALRQLQMELQKEVDGSRNTNRLKQLTRATQSLLNAANELYVNVTPKLVLECALLKSRKSQSI